MIETIIERLEALDQRSTNVDVTLWADAADEAMRQAALALRQLRLALEDLSKHLQQAKDIHVV